MTPFESASASRLIHFRDPRSPHEMRFALERQHMAEFEPVVKETLLEFRATSKCNGLPCAFRLVFEAALAEWNHYSLHMEMSWAHTPPEYHDYYQKSAVSWFDLWCGGLEISPPPEIDGAMKGLYQQRVGEALEAEAHLKDVPALQEAILTALRSGFTFATSHKEGGTRIAYGNGCCFREDFGETSTRETYREEAGFLAALRQFYDSEISKSAASENVSEELAWRLILRRLDPPR